MAQEYRLISALAAMVFGTAACRTDATGSTFVHSQPAPSPSSTRPTGTLFGMHACAVSDLDGDGMEDLAVGDPDDGSETRSRGAIRLYSSRDGRFLGSIVGAGDEDVLGVLFVELPRFGNDAVSALAVVDGGCLWPGGSGYEAWKEGSSRVIVCDPRRRARRAESWSSPPGERVLSMTVLGSDGESTNAVVVTLVDMRDRNPLGRVACVDLGKRALVWSCSPPLVGASFGDVLVAIPRAMPDGGPGVFTTLSEGARLRAYVVDGARGSIVRSTILAEGPRALSACMAFDADGDGTRDIAVALSDEGDASTTPRSIVLVSPKDLKVVGRIEAPTPEERTGVCKFGFAMSSMPDLDGDGEHELAVTSRNGVVPPMRGHVRVFGSSTRTPLRVWEGDGGFGQVVAVLHASQPNSAWRLAIPAFVLEYPALGERVELLDSTSKARIELRPPPFAIDRR